VWEYEKKQCLIRIAKTRGACFDNTGNVLACVYIKDDLGQQKNAIMVDGASSANLV